MEYTNVSPREIRRVNNSVISDICIKNTEMCDIRQQHLNSKCY